VPVDAVHWSGHGELTTLADRVTSMKEEELLSVLVIETLSVSDEAVSMIE
jgi:hypothetical protein